MFQSKFRLYAKETTLSIAVRKWWWEIKKSKQS